MEPDQHFVCRRVAEPVGFGAVFERNVFWSESFLLCKGGICFVEARVKPSDFFVADLASERSEYGELDMVGDFGGAGAATKGSSDEGKEAVSYCCLLSFVDMIARD